MHDTGSMIHDYIILLEGRVPSRPHISLLNLSFYSWPRSAVALADAGLWPTGNAWLSIDRIHKSGLSQCAS